jgi:hypothetical protein
MNNQLVLVSMAMLVGSLQGAVGQLSSATGFASRF